MESGGQIRGKIRTPEALAQRLTDLRAAGKRIVQCHGCFDLVHPGHVRYLEFARGLGDALVVSVTGDALITKGPDRPYIPQELRAENLAALAFVDFVVIDPHPTACELLEQLRPDVYVKGREYANSQDPRFLREREIVENAGGRVVFHSGEVVYSSTQLIRSLDQDQDLDLCRLRTLCQRNGINAASAAQAVHGWSDSRVLIVGDSIRETYVECDAREAADDAPVLALRKLGERGFWGGAAGLARQVRALGAQATLVTIGGESADGVELIRDLGSEGVRVETPLMRDAFPTKTHVIADDAQLYQVYAGDAIALDSVVERKLGSCIRDQFAQADLLIWADHGFGATPTTMQTRLTERARCDGLTVVGHAGAPGGDLTRMGDLDLVAASERQLRNAMHDTATSLPAVVWALLHETHSRAALIGLHKRGRISFDAGAAGGERPTQLERLRSEFVPSLANHTIDLLGAAEAVIACAGLARSSGASFPMLTYLASAGEALASAQPGRTTVDAGVLLAWLQQRPELTGDATSRFQPDSAVRQRERIAAAAVAPVTSG